MKFLVIQQKMIGDVLASSIICNNLRKAYPDAQIDYLIYPFTKPVVENNPNISNLVLFSDEARKSKAGLLRFLLQLRHEKYDVVVDAYGKTESQLATLLSGAKMKVGFYKSYTSFLYHKTIKEIAQPLTNAGTALENRMNLLKLVADDIPFDIRPKIWLTEDELAGGRRLLEQHHVDLSKPVLMIGVLGSGPTKTYPFPFMAQLLDFIVGKTGATLLFNYMTSQTDDATAIYNLCQPETQRHIRIEIVPGSIREFLSVTAHCTALIGNEGGAVNMAKALNVPTFTIFSTWINKEAWNSFEDGTKNVSVHLQDFKPGLYGGLPPKAKKKEALSLYEQYEPTLLLPELDKYLARLIR